MNSPTRISVTALLLMALLVGCGKKTTLVPPQKLVPVRIDDLRYNLDENGATLQWTYPTKLENGDNLQAVESFTIYRAGVPIEEYCPGCPVRFEDSVEIEGGRLESSGASRTGVYRDTSLQPGHRYFYKIRSRAGWWYPSNDSNIVTFVWKAPPQGPRDLRLDAGDRKIILRWEPVDKDSAGNSLGQDILYQVYRKSPAGDFAAIGEPVREPEFVDETVYNEQQYTYKVRALIPGEETLQPGAASQTVSGMPRDLEPPPQPQHLVAVQTSEGVKLVWQAVSADDLAGYRVYRRKGDSGRPEFLGEVGPDQNQFTDQLDQTSGLWFYSVTSVDRSVPFNESAPAGEAVLDLR